MITIISGTNRKDSNTEKIAAIYQEILSEKKIEFLFLSLQKIKSVERNENFEKLESEYLIPAQKFIIVMPEYNGSFPGIVKLMIDNSNVVDCWRNKKVLLCGVSTGRAGNLRGMEHLTGSLMHMQMVVHPNRLPISSVNQIIAKMESFAAIKELIITQVENFLLF